MADLAQARYNIQEEEVAYKAAISESVATRIGKAINFINVRQHDVKEFFINGTYGSIQTGSFPISYVDGMYTFLFDAEITGITMFSAVKGSSGTTELDIWRYTAPSTGATIFSTTPKITSSAANGVWVTTSFSSGSPTDLKTASGATNPRLSIYNVTAGEMIACKLLSAMYGAQNCGITVYFRPR